MPVFLKLFLKVLLLAELSTYSNCPEENRNLLEDYAVSIMVSYIQF